MFSRALFQIDMWNKSNRFGKCSIWLARMAWFTTIRQTRCYTIQKLKKYLGIRKAQQHLHLIVLHVPSCEHLCHCLFNPYLGSGDLCRNIGKADHVQNYQI